MIIRTARPITLAQAKAQYVHRYTMEHVPIWAFKPCNGRYYAPQYASDQEWYDNTEFYLEWDYATHYYCLSTNQSWPLGKWLDKPYSKKEHVMKFKLEIDCSNDAFERDPFAEVVRILRDAAHALERDGDLVARLLRDVNGNTVGRMAIYR